MFMILARRLVVAAVAAMALAGATTWACFIRSIQPVQVWLDHIHVDVTDQVATKTYDCTFLNANSQAVVGGTCYMELEPGAQVDDMSVLVNGKEMKAEILDVEKAKSVFNEMVKNGGSPALLEYYGNQLIQTQIPKIDPNGTVHVKLKYTTVLQNRGGMFRLQMLNTNAKALMQPLKSASVTVNLKSKESIKNVYSPTHEVKFVEKPGWDISLEWKQENYLPKHPFVLYYQTANEAVGASVLAHKELDEEGAFMLMLSPTIGGGAGQVSPSQILPKDVVFCVDTSGSMLQNGKMEQARAALKHCVESLRKGDRFNIVDFSTAARQFDEKGLIEFNDETRAKALRYVEKLSARGGTAIQEALELSLTALGKKEENKGRLKMILFATDGLPTIGEREPDVILRTMSKKNTEDVRIFVFGEGFDVNTKLLDFLALNHRGEADYILPEEKIEDRIGKFFDRVGSPLMTDLQITFEGLETKDVFPRRIPDIYKGEQVILYGRYNGHGSKTVKLSGMVGGERKTFEYKLDFPEISPDDKASFVPRLWAGRKVDFLLNEIRQSNMEKPDKELVEEVTRLAKRFGIITPYTSFLVNDDVSKRQEANAAPAAALQLRKAGGFGLGGGVDGAPGPRGLPAAATGGPAAEKFKEDRVRDSKQLNEQARQFGKGNVAQFEAAADEAVKRERSGKDQSSLQVIRYIGNRTFYQSGSEWQDSVYDAEKHKDVKDVEIGSAEYFKLLDQEPRLAKYLALGDVVVPVQKQWYRFVQKPAKKAG